MRFSLVPPEGGTTNARECKERKPPEGGTTNVRECARVINVRDYKLGGV